MKFGLFLGCNTPAHRPDVEKAIRLTMPALGVELVDLDGYVCCPAFGTFPSADEEAYMAVSGWNLSIAEQNEVDLCIECGSCYSSLRMGRETILKKQEHTDHTNELLGKVERKLTGKSIPRHITDILYNDVGIEKIKAAVKKPLEGIHAVVQYPCHTLYPSELVGFDNPPARPHILAELVEALGATVDHFSAEFQCCGGAGGFTRNSPEEAWNFTKRKLDAIKAETKADIIVVSCITCLMHLDKIQKSLSDDETTYSWPVFDYNQLLALCMGFDPQQVASIEVIDRQAFVEQIR